MLKEPVCSSDKHRVWTLTYSPTFILGLRPLYQSFFSSIIHSGSRLAISKLTFPFLHLHFCTTDLGSQKSKHRCVKELSMGFLPFSFYTSSFHLPHSKIGDQKHRCVKEISTDFQPFAYCTFNFNLPHSEIKGQELTFST